MTGIHPSMISLLESKKPSPTVLVCLKLCRALGVRLEKLLSHAQE